MKTKRDYLIEAVINGNNSFDIDKDKLITQDVMRAMQLYADSKVKKLNKPAVSNSCCDNPELDNGMQLGWGKKLCKNCGGHIAI